MDRELLDHGIPHGGCLFPVRKAALVLWRWEERDEMLSECVIAGVGPIDYWSWLNASYFVEAVSEPFPCWLSGTTFLPRD